MAGNVQLAFAIKAINESQKALKEIQADLKTTGEKAEQATKHTGGLGSALGTMGKIAGGIVLGSGILQAPNFLMSAAQAAADDAASTAKLKQAVDNTGVSYDSLAGSLQATISHAQKMAFTDDQARDALSLLTAQTGSAEEAQKRFGLAMDLARGANIDVVTASKLLGKVTDENVNVLAKYGISVAKGTSETELFGIVQAKFGGQAETFAKSTAGQMEQVKIQMGELKEKIGTALLPVMTALGKVLVEDVIPALNKAGEWIELHIIPAIKEFGAKILDTVMPILKDLAGWFKEHPEAIKAALVGIGAVAAVAFTAWAVAAGAAAVATLAAAAPFIAIGAAIAVLAAGLFLLEEKTEFFSEHLLPTLTGAFDKIREAVGPILADALTTLRQGWEDLQPAVEAVGAFLQENVIPIFQKVGHFLEEHPALLAALAGAILLLVAPWLAVVAALVIVLAKWDEIKAMFTETIPAAIDSVLTKIREIPIIGEIFKAAFETVKAYIEFFWDYYKIYIETAINVIRDVIRIVTALIHGDWSEAWEGVKALVGHIWEGIRLQIENVLDLIKDLILIRLQLIAGIVADIWKLGPNSIYNTIANAMTDAKNWVSDRIGEIVGFFTELPGRVTTALSGLAGALEAAFKAGLNAVIAQINSFIDKFNALRIPGFTIKIPLAPDIKFGGFDFPDMERLATLHHGGIVPGPIGQPMPIIALGGERFLPPGGGGAAGTTIIFERGAFEIQALDADSFQRIIPRLKEALRLELRRAMG